MPSKSQSILLAGAAIGVAATILALIPVIGSCLACITYIGGGVLAVWHYTDRHQLTLSGAQGAGMGALAGIVAMAVAGILQFLFMSMGLTPPFREVIADQLDTSGMDPAQADQILAMASSPLFIVGVVLVALVVYAILGAIGGAIGASLFKKGGDFFEDTSRHTTGL